MTDDGTGMDAATFEEYHDFAAGLKTRGTGIGFAGVGAKVSFNVADCVITETRSNSFSGGSNWYLQSKKRLVWDDIQPSHLEGTGTRVEVRFRLDTKISYADSQSIIKILRRHFLPLFDNAFLDLYQHMGHYSKDLRFVINGQTMTPSDVKSDFQLDRAKVFFPTKAGKRIGYGVLGVAASEYPMRSDICGVVLSTYGKVIKGDLFNQFPGSLGARLFGLVEVPAFVNFLTTSKTDFLRSPDKHREFERLYDPIRQVFKGWLTELGVQQPEEVDTDEAHKLERELKNLIGDVPELANFFGFRIKASVLSPSNSGTTLASNAEGIQGTSPVGEGSRGEGPGPVDAGAEPGQAPVEDPEKPTMGAEPISRSAKRGPRITFKAAPDRPELAWVEGSSIVINRDHPAYKRVRSNSQARRLYSLFAIASAVQKFVGSEHKAPDMAFIDRMMTAWGNR
ncbi:MAG: hypothetical protein HY663_05230 [Chloroflexi bacterium]|nr:hypothetical protein [Chloroflexota bacterium]